MINNKPDIRLNKFVALATGCPRRQADEWIEAGKITINGNTARLGARISKDDVVKLNDSRLVLQPMLYIALNKPTGFVCSRKKQDDTETIYKLLPKQYHQLKSVGRLDKDSSGLILLTNDGDFTYRMTHPSFIKTKIYTVCLDRELQPLHQQMVSDFGVMLADGKSKFTIEKSSSSPLQYTITMHEGRNRQIRRTFAALGYTVTMLHRTTFGEYQIGNLMSGEYSILNNLPSQ
ncbi:rRNA pseudouridine synthase [Candidatus Saccharibacteria bacterium]|jgi:23S rRNA pseudouridine2605 synthase|nr:rRNA pseudouridine synthase [Candidatus Saccharibacteria bacterium]